MFQGEVDTNERCTHNSYGTSVSHISHEIVYSRKRSVLLIIQKSNILCIWAVYRCKTCKMENEKLLVIQGVAITSSHFYTEIALRMLDGKLCFDVFAIARSIFIELYDSH